MLTLPLPIVVCVSADLPVVFADDRFGTCLVCGGRVRFRPHAPTDGSIVCVLCWIVQAEPGQACFVTDSTLEELRALGLMEPSC